MHDKQPKDTRKEKLEEIPVRHSGIWFWVALLALLTFLTLGLLAALLNYRAGGEQNIIRIRAQEEIYETYEEVVETEAGEDEMHTYTAQSSPDQTSGMVTYDDEGTWVTRTSIDLFKTAYDNADGSVTVQSGNGDKVIAPGTSNTYRFALKNTGTTTLHYTLLLKQYFSLPGGMLSFQVRLRQGDRWLAGSEDEWVTPEELEDIEESGTLETYHYVTYVLEWRWPYESEEADAQAEGDSSDTLLGDTAVSEDVEFQLDILTTATAEEESAVVRAPTLIQTTREVIETYILPAKLELPLGVLLCLFAGTWFQLLFWWRKRINFTGYMKDAGGALLAGHTLRLESKWYKNMECVVGREGDFSFLSIPAGKKKLILLDEEENELNHNDITLKWMKRSKSEEEQEAHGKTDEHNKAHRIEKTLEIETEHEEGKTIIRMARNLVTIEIHMVRHAPMDAMMVRTDLWSTVDKKDNIIATFPDSEGSKEENHDKTNH